MHELATRLSAGLLRIASRLMPQEEAHWRDAMRAELHHIDGAGEKLMFAAGCLTASVGRAAANGGVEHTIRTMLIPSVFIWSAGKVYLCLVLPGERLMPFASEMIALSALGYACSAMWLLYRNLIAALATLLVPLMANIVHFGMTAHTGYLEDIALLSLAIVAEDFAIWIAATLGLAAMLILPKIRAEQHG